MGKPRKMTTGQSVKRRIVVEKFHVVGTTHNDSFNLLPLLSWVNSQTFGKIYYTEGLHVAGAWGPRQHL